MLNNKSINNIKTINNNIKISNIKITNKSIQDKIINSIPILFKLNKQAITNLYKLLICLWSQVQESELGIIALKLTKIPKPKSKIFLSNHKDNYHINYRLIFINNKWCNKISINKVKTNINIWTRLKMDMLKNLINFMLSILKIIMEIFFRVNKF